MSKYKIKLKMNKNYKETYYPCGKIKTQEYYDLNVLSRDNEPAYIVYSKDGFIIRQAFYKQGKLHNEFGPASAMYDKAGDIMLQEFYLNGEKVDKSAIAQKSEISEQPETQLNGRYKEKYKESYYKNNVLHRDDGPALIVLDFDGNIREVSYYSDGLLHRKDGPAKIIYDHKGNVITERCFQNGKRLRDCKENGFLMAEH